MRIDPPVSLPSASGTIRAASATPEPPLDPPGMRDGSHGLRLDPTDSLTDVMPQANSCVWVLPTRMPPAARTAASAAASRSGTCSANSADP